MSPERRNALIRLLATIDQQLAEAESLATDPELTEAEQQYVVAQMEFRNRSLARVEAMLGVVRSGSRACRSSTSTRGRPPSLS